ncbi:MAG: putative lipid II flippase FtsW [Candidatus Moraniibacteriota bacterium]|nr:MAG: putative lipid II flippase FtsW [Candidatus Moranbacteria bacterium]
MRLQYKHAYDKVLFGSVVIAVVFGLLMIASASALYAEIRFQDQYFFLKRQLLFGVLPGMAVLFFLSLIDYHKWRKFSVFGFILSLIALGLIFVPGFGNEAYGATRWLNLGPVSFQPSEMAKIAIIVYLSAWLSSKGKKKVSNFFEGLIPFLIILSLMGVFILNQPDVGTLGSIIFISVILFFSAGAQISHLASLGVVGMLGFFIIVKSAPYRWDRLMVFLNPELDPQGKGYQINQALIALGSGGLFGLGLGESRQKFNYLPEPVGDSIFAIIGEEWGFIGTLCLLILFAVIIWRGFRIAVEAPDDFGRLLAIGVTSWIAMQVVFNVGAITGILPLTGIPLPFISYGGTSLLFSLAAMGLLLNISRQSVRK